MLIGFIILSLRKRFLGLAGGPLPRAVDTSYAVLTSFNDAIETRQLAAVPLDRNQPRLSKPGIGLGCI